MLKPLWLLNALQLRPRYRPRSPTVLNTSAATLACQNLARFWPKVGTSADIARYHRLGYTSRVEDAEIPCIFSDIAP